MAKKVENEKVETEKTLFNDDFSLWAILLLALLSPTPVQEQPVINIYVGDVKNVQ